MAHLRNLFILFTIFMIIISLSSCSSNIKFYDEDTLREAQDHNMNLEREFGYDFQAYPSNYFNTIDLEDNNNYYDQISRFNRFKNLEKDEAVGVTTINVESFGAKGDGNTDDTNVSS